MATATQNFFEILQLRSEWEELVEDYKIADDRKHGTIQNLKWFLRHGKSSNRFRKDFGKSMELAQNMVNLYNAETNLPSLYR